MSIARGTKMQALRARGEGAAPKLRLTGPHGQIVETPAGGELVQSPQALIVQEQEAKATTILLFAPEAGRWTVSRTDGGALGTLEMARDLRRATVSAKVTRRGARRVLRWRFDGPARHSVRFAERSRGGSRVLVTTSKRRGHVVFTPVARGGIHKIEAGVLNEGLPRENLTVASFKTARPVLRKVRGLRLSSRGRLLIVAPLRKRSRLRGGCQGTQRLTSSLARRPSRGFAFPHRWDNRPTACRSWRSRPTIAPDRRPAL